MAGWYADLARPVRAWERAIKWVKRRPELPAIVPWFPWRYRADRRRHLVHARALEGARPCEPGPVCGRMNLARRTLDSGLIYQVREQLKASPYRSQRISGGSNATTAPTSAIKRRSDWSRHQNAVICLAFHPDGNQVVSGGADGTVRVWDLTSRREFTISIARDLYPWRCRQPGPPLAGCRR